METFTTDELRAISRWLNLRLNELMGETERRTNEHERTYGQIGIHMLQSFIIEANKAVGKADRK